MILSPVETLNKNLESLQLAIDEFGELIKEIEQLLEECENQEIFEIDW
jgi:prefoldin subunit 5